MMSFDTDGLAYTATSADGRTWRITEERTGWRLEFRDLGDALATNAGVHATLDAAIAEAVRVPARGGRRR